MAILTSSDDTSFPCVTPLLSASKDTFSGRGGASSCSSCSFTGSGGGGGGGGGGGRWSLVFLGSGWDRLNLEGLGLPVEAEAQENVFPILLTGLSFVAYCRPVPPTAPLPPSLSLSLSLSLCFLKRVSDTWSHPVFVALISFQVSLRLITDVLCLKEPFKEWDSNRKKIRTAFKF